MKDTATEHANSEMSEPEAIRRAQRGDATAFEYLYNSHSKRVYTICLRMLKNRDDAEDLTQQVFLQVFRRISTFRAESGFATWLHRVTVNIVLMHLRRKRPEVSADSLEQGGANGKFCQEFDAKDVSLLGTIDRLNLRRAIRRLPSAYRRLRLLHDVIGCQHGEIAGILRRSRGASKGQLYRARKQLRDLLQGKRADDGKIPGLQAALRGRRGTPRPSPYYLRVDDEKSGLSDSQGKGRLLDLGQKKKRSGAGDYLRAWCADD